MRIGYFGGSFDPPHRGHLTVARAARDRFALDRVLLAPTARQPLKPQGPEASFVDRLRMTELLCAGELRLEASPIDGPQPGDAPNYTADTLRHLHAELAQLAQLAQLDALAQTPPGARDSDLPGCHSRRESASPAPESGSPSTRSARPQILAILGADAFHTFHRWHEPDALLHLADWIIVSRPGFPPPPLDSFTPAQRTRLHLLPDIADPVSATALRTRLHAGHAYETCQEFIPPAVLSYIAQHGLYR